MDFFSSSNPEKKLPSSVSSVSFAWRKIKEERKGGAFTKQEVGRKRYLEIKLHLNI